MCEQRSFTNATVTKRFFGGGEQISGTNYFFTRDHLGNIREMTDGTAAIRARYDYDPYGRRTKVSGNLDADFGFTGHYVHSVSGLYLALFRAYDSESGRWLSRDPIAESGGINLYGYAGANPLNLIDPLGLEFGDFYDISATMAYYRNLQNTSESGLARSGAQIANFLLSMVGADNAQNAGTDAGYGHYRCSFGQGGLALLKGISSVGGGKLAASILTGGVKRIGVFFGTETLSSGYFSSLYWGARGGATQLGTAWELHHWFAPARAIGNRVGSANLVAIPEALNRYMNGAASTLWMENMIRYGILGAPLAGAAFGTGVGIANASCENK